MKVPVLSRDGTPLGETSVSVAGKESAPTVVLAHGAGGTMDTPSLVSLQKSLAEEGITAVRFNFLYTENKKRTPDKPATLVDTWRSVAEWVRSELRPTKLFLGGRSMGGRMASHLVSEGYPCDGLVFLAYPLHPPGKRDRQRKDHLPEIRVPMLFVSGTKDSFADLDLLEPLVATLRAKLHLIEGADHGHKVPKKYGKTAAEVEAEVVRAVLELVKGR
ncbi:MAG TPA: alpha/beta fold hydrolase [Vicinamibacteria bacterium]|nr:alpha/beta fold hydrolase [Vicinamibacteria bacterium]